MSLTPYVVAMIKCGYDGPAEGDFAPISCFTPPSPGYILAANIDAGTYAEILNCDSCIFEATPGLYVVNIWNGQEWRIDYVEAPQKGYIITGTRTGGSMFTTSPKVTATTPVVDIWQPIAFFTVSYITGQLIKAITPQTNRLQELIMFIITYLIFNFIGINNIWRAFIAFLVIYLIMYAASRR